MRDEKGTKKSSLGSYLFVGCLVVGLGIGIGFELMPAALIIGFGVGLIAIGIARYKNW
jgi:hypothetical protein